MKGKAIHPCFDKDASRTYMRLHLPVAPLCNIQCRYCLRKFDCVNESRPGVTTSLLSPYQALYYFKQVRGDNPVSVVGIAGPGDTLATPEKSLLTLKLIKTEEPDMHLCISTNGLVLPEYVAALRDAGCEYLTVTVNAVDPAIGKMIYSWVRYKNKRYMNKDAAELLLDRQLEGIRKACNAGMKVKVNTLLIPGINDNHIPVVAERMAELGVTMQNILPFIPVEGTDFADISPPSHTYVTQIRKMASKHLKQMGHCGRCRADAFGFLDKKGTDHYSTLKEIENMPLNPMEKREYIAVASEEGILINKHLGQATELYIYKIDNNAFTFIEERKTPSPGLGDKRWDILCSLLSDCHTLLVSGIGPSPYQRLTRGHIKVYSLEGLIEEALGCLAAGEPLDHLHKRVSGVCSGCYDKKAECS